MTIEGNGGTIKSDVTLLNIIAKLQELKTAGVTELASELGLAKGTVHKHLKTLAEAKYVHNDDGTYRLSLKFLEHGGFVRDNTRICSIGREHIMDLSDKTGEMVILGIKDFDVGTFVFRSKDPFGLMQSVPIGQRFPLHQNAAGKAILAELPDETIEKIISRYGLPASTDQTITDQEALWNQVDLIRQQGYSINLGEKTQGIWAVSAAVRDPVQKKIGAISVTVPESATSEKKLTGEYSEKVIETAGALNLRLKHDTER